jgi:hypothetical protein
LDGDPEAVELAPSYDDAAAARLKGWLDDYRPLADVPDELAPPGGSTPEPWLRFLRAVAAYPEGDFAERFAISGTLGSPTESTARTASASGPSAPCP